MLSIVIITKGRPAEVDRAMESCLRWLQTDREFILIDNSTDNCLKEIANRFRYIHPKERIIYEAEGRNTGVSGGRNRGWQLSNGEYVLFLDDDATISSIQCPIDELLFEFERDSRIAILALQVYVPPYDLFMKPRTWIGKNGECALFFIGAAHIISKKALKLSKLYPEVLTYGHEDLFLSLQCQQMELEIRYERRVLVNHYPSKIRMDFIQEKKNGIVNKYVVKRCFFPVVFFPVIYIGFQRRNWLFWKTNLKEIIECNSLARERLREIGDCKKLSIEQAILLLKRYGLDFLWEISHNRSDKKLGGKEDSYEHE